MHGASGLPAFGCRPGLCAVLFSLACVGSSVLLRGLAVVLLWVADLLAVCAWCFGGNVLPLEFSVVAQCVAGFCAQAVWLSPFGVAWRLSLGRARGIRHGRALLVPCMSWGLGLVVGRMYVPSCA